MHKNIILMTDSYKASHFKQYPEGTTKVTSYIEARAGGLYTHVVFFGLQAFIREYLSTRITRRDIDEAEKVFTAHGVPFNREGWLYIYREYGYLPLVIEAIPEGSVVPVGTPLVQVHNTDPKCAWLTSYIETALLRAIWYPSTIATASYFARGKLNYFVQNSTDGDVDSILDFMLHDFGARGVSSGESAMLGGMAHLLNFKGTDTVEGMVGAVRYYDAEIAPGYSVPASEHSTMTSWGRDREVDAYRNMLEQFPEGIVSIVADSYDYEAAVVDLFCGKLRDLVDARAGKGRVVIRPDSGDPIRTVLFTLEHLRACFGYTNNSKGYDVLPDHIRILWGDGIGVPQMEGILAAMINAGFAAENIVFGMGGGLLQKVNRDTLRFAMKANEIEIDGITQAVAKQPKTDATKASKAGRQQVWEHTGSNGIIVTPASQIIKGPGYRPLMMTRFQSGGAVNESTFDEVRARVLSPFVTLDQQKVA